MRAHMLASGVFVSCSRGLISRLTTTSGPLVVPRVRGREEGWGRAPRSPHPTLPKHAILLSTLSVARTLLSLPPPNRSLPLSLVSFFVQLGSKLLFPRLRGGRGLGPPRPDLAEVGVLQPRLLVRRAVARLPGPGQGRAGATARCDAVPSSPFFSMPFALSPEGMKVLRVVCRPVVS